MPGFCRYGAGLSDRQAQGLGGESFSGNSGRASSSNVGGANPMMLFWDFQGAVSSGLPGSQYWRVLRLPCVPEEGGLQDEAQCTGYFAYKSRCGGFAVVDPRQDIR